MPDLLNEMLDAHGGLENWRRVSTIEQVYSVTGELWPRRKVEGILKHAHLIIEAQREAITYLDYTAPGLTGHFTPERVWITDADGQVIEERDDPRSAFEGQDMKQPWHPLDVLFANGFGTWTETTLPFLFGTLGENVRELDPVTDEHGHWRRLTADFPDSVLTHKEQELWIGEDGLIDRFVFVPGVGGVMKSAVWISDYVTIDGFRLPTKRRMVPLGDDGRPKAEPVMLKEDDIRYTLS